MFPERTENYFSYPQMSFRNLPCLFLFREISIRLSQPSFLHLLWAEFSANEALR